MNQKIEWYKEVLEIEPNSKIFFPLARMLVKDSRPEEAIAILRQGVGRHPDHIEARLFLAELLYSYGKSIDLQQEIEVLSVLFKNYPGFWRAWGERLFDEENTRDAGLAAIFLAAFLQNTPISWAGVIEHGLKSLVSEHAPRGSATVAETYPLFREPSPMVPVVAAAPVERPVPPDAAALPAMPEASLAPALAKETPEAAGSGTLPDTAFDESDDADDEPITLRTRSMAEVLAEQGDVSGALDIYNELLSSAKSESEKKDLRARIDALSCSSAQSDGQGVDASAKEEKKDWLAILAQRLEARSLQ